MQMTLELVIGDAHYHVQQEHDAYSVVMLISKGRFAIECALLAATDSLRRALAVQIDECKRLGQRVNKFGLGEK